MLSIKPYQAASTFAMHCPACGVRREDPFELLGTDEVHTLRCEGCSEPSSILLKECRYCGEESLFLWHTRPATATLEGLCCQWCARAFNAAAHTDDDPCLAG